MREKHAALRMKVLTQARRRLINQLSPRLQLDLFEDRSMDADLALTQLKAGLNRLRTRIERKV